MSNLIELGSLAENEKGLSSTTVNVEDQIVTVYHVSEIAGVQYQCRTIFNYSECTQAMILEHAAKTDVITMRRQYKLKDAPMSEAATLIDLNIDVNEMEERATRKKADPVEKAKALFARMTPEQREAFLLGTV